MSAICPRGYGWNILDLKWPYFQAMAHRETRLNCVPEQKCRSEARQRDARQKLVGKYPRNIKSCPVIYISNSAIWEAPPCKLKSLSFP